MKVKNNVDDMIYQVLNYIDHSKLPDDEAETLVYEILSTIIMWNCDWDPENIDLESIGTQVNKMLLMLSIAIPANLEECIKIAGYRETGE
jgi:hypothetical protein